MARLRFTRCARLWFALALGVLVADASACFCASCTCLCARGASLAPCALPVSWSPESAPRARVFGEFEFGWPWRCARAVAQPGDAALQLRRQVLRVWFVVALLCMQVRRVCMRLARSGLHKWQLV